MEKASEAIAKVLGGRGEDASEVSQTKNIYLGPHLLPRQDSRFALGRSSSLAIVPLRSTIG